MWFGEGEEDGTPDGKVRSRLRQWPIQLHLVSPEAPYFREADVLLAADCTAFAMGYFQEEYLKGRALAILCPKLDAERDLYVAKIRSLVEDCRIASLTIAIMQVPCCRGLVSLVAKALADVYRKVPVRVVIVGLQGDIPRDGPAEA
jgi:hypothetical protein